MEERGTPSSRFTIYDLRVMAFYGYTFAQSFNEGRREGRCQNLLD
jgi:hypothetical protein